MKLRLRPEDFVVEEVLAEAVRVRLRPRADKAARFAVLELRKTSLSTPEAAARLARTLNVPPSKVEHAGLKDKHAVTVQHVTAEWDGRDPTRAFGGEAQSWSARVLGWSAEPTKPAWIARNRFAIVARGLSAADAAEMDRCAAGLAESGSLVVVNYFGDQRFGSARHGAGFAAKNLVRGDFEGALRLLIGTPARKDAGPRRGVTRALAEQWGDWDAVLERTPRCPERRAVEVLAAGGDARTAFAALPNFEQQMCVDAYQSLLWNRAAARLARRMIEESGSEAVRVHADRGYGEMVFPPARAIGAAWRGVEMPMPGPGMGAAPPWGGVMDAVIAEEGITSENLRVPGLRRPTFGTPPRSLVVSVEGLAVGETMRDDEAAAGSPRGFKRLVRFSLPRGAYATVVLRALGA